VTTLFYNRFWLELNVSTNHLDGKSYHLGSNGQTLAIEDDLSHPSASSIEILKMKLTGKAAVIVSINNNSITIVTDTYGTLPIYLYNEGSHYCIFSHFPDLFQTIAPHSLTPDNVGIWETMLYDATIHMRTIFKEISMIPTATCVTVNLLNEEITMAKFSNLSFPDIESIDSHEAGIAIVDKLKNALATHREKHFLLPLSGGIDSRLLAGAMVEVFGPDRITALSFACRNSSYELKYAKQVCDTLGIKDWKTHILTDESYMRSLNMLPKRLGGNLSISHGHLFDALSTNEGAFDQMTLVSGAFADAAGGFHASPPNTRRESHYYHHLNSMNTVLGLGKYKQRFLDDLNSVNQLWQNHSTINSFDEYFYITNRQPKVIFTQSMLYRDFLPTIQPFTDLFLSDFLFGLPYNLRAYKQSLRMAILSISTELAELPDISSKMINRTKSDWIHIYRGKVLNNLARIATRTTFDKHLFFSPYQTECQDYNLRTSHRKKVLTAFSNLIQKGIISSEQSKILTQKPYKQLGGGLLPCVQYWAITISETLNNLKFFHKQSS
jgi:hypothetical protein